MKNSLAQEQRNVSSSASRHSSQKPTDTCQNIQHTQRHESKRRASLKLLLSLRCWLCGTWHICGLHSSEKKKKVHSGVHQRALRTSQYFSHPQYVTRNEAKELRSQAKKALKTHRPIPTLLLTYPQCFIFWGLSMRMASLILRSWSGQALVKVILWSSDCLGLFGVGWRTTYRSSK